MIRVGIRHVRRGFLAVDRQIVNLHPKAKRDDSKTSQFNAAPCYLLQGRNDPAMNHTVEGVGSDINQEAEDEDNTSDKGA